MSFPPFITLLLVVYTLYYLVLFSVDRISRRSMQITSDDRIDYITAPVITPVKVSASHTTPNPIYQMDGSNNEEFTDENTQDQVIENIGMVHAADRRCLAYDLGLETITAATGIPVASPGFWNLFGK